MRTARNSSGNWRVWVMLCLVLAAIGLLGYFAFYEVGDTTDAPPRVISGGPPPAAGDSVSSGVSDSESSASAAAAPAPAAAPGEQ